MDPDALATAAPRRVEAPGRRGVPRPDHYLHPEQAFASAEPKTVMTILGSCVSICLWDEERGAGGINHFLLPHDPTGGVSRARGGRYGRQALTLLLERLDSLGCRRANLQAKVFGGARIQVPTGVTGVSLGQQNAELATALLRELGIPVVAMDVCGDHGRKLLFRTSDGAAWVRPILGEDHE